MIRAVLAVLVGIALLATAMPALTDARAQTTHEQFGSMAAEIANTADQLRSRSTAVGARDLAARASLHLRRPTGFGTAPVETAAIGCPTAVLTDRADPPPDCPAALVYRLRGAEPTIRSVPAVDLTTPAGPVRLAEPTVGIQLRYVRVDGASVVEATRVNASRTET